MYNLEGTGALTVVCQWTSTNRLLQTAVSNKEITIVKTSNIALKYCRNVFMLHEIFIFFKKVFTNTQVHRAIVTTGTIQVHHFMERSSQLALFRCTSSRSDRHNCHYSDAPVHGAIVTTGTIQVHQFTERSSQLALFRCTSSRSDRHKWSVVKCNRLLKLGRPVGAVTLSRWEWWWNERWIWGARGGLNLISTNYPHHGHHGRLPLSRKNAHGRAGNRTRNLMVSSQELWPPSHEAGHIC